MPKTCAIMEAKVTDATHFKDGTIKLSLMEAGTHVVAHTAASNSRLRIHLGLETPEGAHMRVTDFNVAWEKGKVCHGMWLRQLSAQRTLPHLV